MSEFVNVNIMGGLGNQLFQIATCLSYAWKYDLKPIFDKSEWVGLESHPGAHWKTFLIRLNEFLVDNNEFVNVLDYHSPQFNYNPIPSPSELESKNCDKESEDKESGGKVVIRLHGYFQCEKYFGTYRKKILELFQPADECIFKINNKYQDIISNIDNVGILHIRRGDYVKFQNIHPLMTMEYYTTAMKIIEEKLERKLKWYIIGEEHVWIKQQELFKDCTILSNDYDYEDLWIMTYFKYFIIANSTFSWWGAWLSQRDNKIVICPKNWFGPGGPQSFESIYPEDWILS